MIRIKDVKKMMEANAEGFLQGDAQSWLDANGISAPAFKYVIEQLEQVLREGLAEGAIQEIIEDEEVNPALMMSFAIQAIIGAAFTVGWELHAEYGEKFERPLSKENKDDLLRGLDFPIEE